MGVYTRRKSSVTQNNLPLDVSRTKELIVDFQTKGGKDIHPPPPVYVSGAATRSCDFLI